MPLKYHVFHIGCRRQHALALLQHVYGMCALQCVNDLGHAQGFSSKFGLFETWPSARGLGDVFRTVTPAEAARVLGPQGIAPYNMLITPNALREARAHFGCLLMEGIVMEERGERFTEHWSLRHYNVCLCTCCREDMRTGRVLMLSVDTGPGWPCSGPIMQGIAGSPNQLF